MDWWAWCVTLIALVSPDRKRRKQGFIRKQHLCRGKRWHLSGGQHGVVNFYVGQEVCPIRQSTMVESITPGFRVTSRLDPQSPLTRGLLLIFMVFLIWLKCLEQLSNHFVMPSIYNNKWRQLIWAISCHLFVMFGLFSKDNVLLKRKAFQGTHKHSRLTRFLWMDDKWL